MRRRDRKTWPQRAWRRRGTGGLRDNAPISDPAPLVWRDRRAWPQRAWRRRGTGGLRDDAPISDPATLVWRAPEGPEGQAAVPVGGGRARAGLEIDHSEPQARVWRSRGRAAAHGRTKQPGPTAGSDGARNTSGATSSPAQQAADND